MVLVLLVPVRTRARLNQTRQVALTIHPKVAHVWIVALAGERRPELLVTLGSTRLTWDCH